MTMPQPGIDGEPLPAATLVFRIAKGVRLNSQALTKGDALEIFFKPSKDDEKSPGRRLSVWVEAMTLPDQAWEFADRDPAYTVALCLGVDDIRAVIPPEPFDPLDVEWEKAKLKDGSDNTKPGAEGHAGITGLLQGGKREKDQRKELRSRLADKASVSPVPVPHDIPEEHLRIAAYFIYENGEDPDGTCETHWVSAVRQLRRVRVRESRPLV